MSRYSDVTNAVTQIELSKGNAAAEAQRQSGQIWGNALGNIGNLVANLPGQLAQQKTLQLQQQEAQFKMDAAKRAQAGEAQANQIIASFPRNPDNTYDTGKLTQQLAEKNVPLAQSERLVSSVDNLNKIITSWNDAKSSHLKKAAGFLLDAHQDGEPLTPESVHLTAAALKPSGLISDQDETSLTQLMASGIDPRTMLERLRDAGEKPVTLKSDERLISPSGRTIVAAQASQKTEAELAADAANPQSPTAAQSKAALDLLKVSKGTAEQDDQRYRNIQAALTQRQPVTPDDLAWAKGYEKQKTLGVDTTASAAAQRQATAINAQVQQQGRAQGFQEAQAGRKELTEKVEQPYQTALTSAQTLRDVVASAKAGNKIAANLQNLETTMAAIRAQGLNRINTTEIGVAANAGNLWDRIQGRIGALTAGQAVPPDLQKNMEEFAGILEKSAYAKYKTGFDATTKRYNLADEKPMPAPGSATSGISVQAPNGKTYTFQSQADADAFKAKAGIK